MPGSSWSADYPDVLNKRLQASQSEEIAWSIQIRERAKLGVEPAKFLLFDPRGVELSAYRSHLELAGGDRPLDQREHLPPVDRKQGLIVPSDHGDDCFDPVRRGNEMANKGRFSERHIATHNKAAVMCRGGKPGLDPDEWTSDGVPVPHEAGPYRDGHLRASDNERLGKYHSQTANDVFKEGAGGGIDERLCPSHSPRLASGKDYQAGVFFSGNRAHARSSS